MNRYQCLSPIDFRYWDSEVAEYLSEDAFTRYKLQVEVALVEALAALEICSADVVAEIKAACELVTTEDVYEEEGRIHHDIRALVNCIRQHVSDDAKPFVHMMATSYDIIDTANALRFTEVTRLVVIPQLLALEEVLIDLALREAETLQIGRTHGQHAVPITFGFAIAEYANRLGLSILKLLKLSEELCGKFSGAVGGYNASSLFVEDPEAFEMDVMQRLGLSPSRHSTQIVQPEPMGRLLFELSLVASIVGNLADDMRHLQRTEIGEIGEAFGDDQVGSSTMPQKRNPINFENIKGMWKIVVGRLVTVLMDQLSEHQRDLTGSVSARTNVEIVAYVVSMTKRMTRTMQKLSVDAEALRRNIAMQGSFISAEPLYLLLATLGHPNAHEVVRQCTLEAQRRNVPLFVVVENSKELAPYLERMTAHQRRIIPQPTLYVGISAQKARSVAGYWRDLLFD